MADCLFCKIVTGDIPVTLLYQDEHVVAFADINPQAPTHLLIIPRRHISTMNDLTDADAELMGKLQLAAVHLARQFAVDQSGYRTVMNCNADAGQTVFHIHLHLLGGRIMAWPPG